MKRLSLQHTNRPLDCILHWRKSGQLLLDPPYQRGDVWGEIRRRNLIKSLCQGVPIASMILNDRSRSGTWPEADMWSLAVIDGKQRLTTILMFLDDGFTVPCEWFIEGLGGECLFSHLPIARQRGFRNLAIPFSEGSLGSLEEEQEVFELVNYGGVPQGESDPCP